MFCRIWRGWTTVPNAPAYKELRYSTVISGIEARAIRRFRSIGMMRRELGDEAEFTRIMLFDSAGTDQAFMGEDHEIAHVPAAALGVLSRFNDRAVHHDLLDRREQAEQS